MKLPLRTRWFGQPISTVSPTDYCTYAEAVELIDQGFVDFEDRPLTGAVFHRVSEDGTPFLDLFWEHKQ